MVCEHCKKTFTGYYIVVAMKMFFCSEWCFTKYFNPERR